MKRIMILTIVVSVLFIPLVIPKGYCGSIEFTTYYPAPYGAYDIIQFVPRPEITMAKCPEGSIYYNASMTEHYGTMTPSGFFYCIEGTWVRPWVWVQRGNNILLSDSSDPELKRVGVGITDVSDLEFMLTLDSDGGILAKGNLGAGEILTTSGEGTRMIWYPRQAAFRAGHVSGSNWDRENIGDYSVAMGFDSIASGEASVALGNRSEAVALRSTALGSNAKADGLYSMALGLNTTASRDYSTAMGSNTTAGGDAGGIHSIAMGSNAWTDGDFAIAMGKTVTARGYASVAMNDNTQTEGAYSVAMGQQTRTDGEASLAMGYSSNAYGDYSVAMGDRAEALGDYSVALGDHTIAQAHGSVALGSYNLDNSEHLFAIGKGTSSYRSNAVTVLTNGNMSIGGYDPPVKLEVKGAVKFENVHESLDLTQAAIPENCIRYGNIQQCWGETGDLYPTISQNHETFYYPPFTEVPQVIAASTVRGSCNCSAGELGVSSVQENSVTIYAQRYAPCDDITWVNRCSWIAIGKWRN